MPSRRRVLVRAAGGLAGVTALAGCSVLGGMPNGIALAVGEPDSTPTQSPDQPPSPSPSPTPGQTAPDSAAGTPPDASETPVEDDDPPGQQIIRYRDLSPAEHALVEKGLDGGYRTCEEVPDAADALADRIQTPNVYLLYQGDVNGIWLAITDMVFADTTDPPDGECGWL